MKRKENEKGGRGVVSCDFYLYIISTCAPYTVQRSPLFFFYAQFLSKRKPSPLGSHDLNDIPSQQNQF